ncbi:MAG: hypothetical protein KKE44_05765 [Proteobacteria bacterium]|nr:hypothetical protein [Pseudomonadota bacterium]MBU1582236.1 hypothetical protein [Pseudomonadota bacterium]MBU2454392.1 hypothetical protein [Pseudomonadota bacterium]MBU2631167.1 hypothetical protein [Pseudomonadota bacterium]
MNKREIIIISLAVIIGIYGLLDYFVFSGKKMNGEDKKTGVAVERINAFAESAGLNLSSIIAKKDFQDTAYLISKAEIKWDNDPFLVYDPNEIKLEEDFSAQGIPELAYTGFIQAGKKVLAVVNGMEYALGEMLKDVGYKVFSITPSRVVLLTEANKEIILQLEEK